MSFYTRFTFSRLINRLCSVWVLLCFILLGAHTALVAAPAPREGFEFRFEQPGETEPYFGALHGDEFYHYATYKGYTIVRNKDDQVWYYAELSPDKMFLQPSRERVRHRIELAPTIRRNIQLPLAIRYSMAREQYLYRFEHGEQQRLRDKIARYRRYANDECVNYYVTLYRYLFGTYRPSPRDIDRTPGSVRAIVVPVFEPENSPFNARNDAREWLTMFHADTERALSVRDYFRIQSVGAFDAQFDVTKPVMLNPSVYEAQSDAIDPEKLVHFVLEQLREGDYLEGIDVEKSETLHGVALFIVHLFPPDELWPQTFRGTLRGETLQGKPLYSVSLAPLYNTGVFAHEYAHQVFNANDLYNFNVDSRISSCGVGAYSLMGTGATNNFGASPAMMNPLIRNELGWLTFIDLPTSAQNITLRADSNIAYTHAQRKDGEFLIIDPRARNNGNALNNHLPSEGVLLWHADLLRDPLLNTNAAARAYFDMELVTADRVLDLARGENVGDIADAAGHLFAPRQFPFPEPLHRDSEVSLTPSLFDIRFPAHEINVLTGTYNWRTTLRPPRFSHESAVVHQPFVLAANTPFGVIRYTDNGADPTREDPIFPPNGLLVDTSVTVRAAVFIKDAASAVETVTFTLDRTLAPPPIVLPHSGFFATDAPLIIRSKSDVSYIGHDYDHPFTADCRLIATLKTPYSRPLRFEPVYTATPSEPVRFSDRQTYQFYTDSPIIVKRHYLFVSDRAVSAEVAFMETATDTGKRLTLSSPDSQACIFYTLNGSEPSPWSEIYSKPLEFDDVALVKALALDNGKYVSGVTEFSVIPDHYQRKKPFYVPENVRDSEYVLPQVNSSPAPQDTVQRADSEMIGIAGDPTQIITFDDGAPVPLFIPMEIPEMLPDSCIWLAVVLSSGRTEIDFTAPNMIARGKNVYAISVKHARKQGGITLFYNATARTESRTTLAIALRTTPENCLNPEKSTAQFVLVRSPRERDYVCLAPTDSYVLVHRIGVYTLINDALKRHGTISKKRFYPKPNVAMGYCTRLKYKTNDGKESILYAYAGTPFMPGQNLIIDKKALEATKRYSEDVPAYYTLTCQTPFASKNTFIDIPVHHEGATIRYHSYPFKLYNALTLARARAAGAYFHDVAAKNDIVRPDAGMRLFVHYEHVPTPSNPTRVEQYQVELGAFYVRLPEVITAAQIGRTLQCRGRYFTPRMRAYVEYMTPDLHVRTLRADVQSDPENPDALTVTLPPAPPEEFYDKAYPARVVLESDVGLCDVGEVTL